MDNRTRVTKIIIKEALFKLLNEKSLNKITVKEICDIAKVNRGTFYKYYKDVFDLMDMINNDYFLQVKENIEITNLNLNSYNFILNIFDIIKKNKDISFLILNDDYSNNPIIQQLVNLAYEQSVQEWKKFNPKINDEQTMMLFTYMSNGNIAIIRNWVKQNCPDNTKQIAKFVESTNKLLFENFIKKLPIQRVVFFIKFC